MVERRVRGRIVVEGFRLIGGIVRVVWRDWMIWLILMVVENKLVRTCM